jgi:phosphatidylserine/phosphatidylglycerophosphate/cardiolipin synthase-like enzyme
MIDPVTSIPGWIADLATAVCRLSAAQLRILADSYRRNEPALAPSTVQLQRNLSLSTTDTAHLVRELKQIMTAPDVTCHDIGIVLETLAHARLVVTARDEKIEVVCTAPSRLGVPVRTTFATTVEMVQAARQEIFIVGYVFTEGARGLIEEIAVARRVRGVQVTLIGNRMQYQLTTLRSLWPADSPAPSIFSRKADPSDDMIALHAKLLICDSTVALITSANFSYHGLHENIEIGVKIQSASVARLVEFAQAMIRMGEVEVIQWSGAKN